MPIIKVAGARTLTLLMRDYCHLCHDMERAVLPLLVEFGAGLERIDIDADPELEARYGELVPVLLDEGVELCHYFLDAARVRAVLSDDGERP